MTQMGQSSQQTVIREKLRKALSYVKGKCKMLMKLIPSCLVMLKIDKSTKVTLRIKVEKP